ncbi:MAG: alpha-glucan family phosphorylase [Alphaproteobacteria bacterium]|nr:alpha-glucan family phosphorylase [Alphaproteobacteria bacterium]
MKFNNYKIPYTPSPEFSKRVAYFSMEFAIDQPLKIYSGGLGFLSGSHLRSAYELKQNLIGIGILWKYGYYDQARNKDQSLQVGFMEKNFHFLEDTGIEFQIPMHSSQIWVKVWYLNPEVFNSAPLFLLSTDTPKNDYLSNTITHRLYDGNASTKLAQFILLGIGGAKLLDQIGYLPEVYHLNEAHGISAAFYLLNKFKEKEVVKQHLVFTTHTPEEAGNEKHNIHLVNEMGYFYGLSVPEVKDLIGMDAHDDNFNHSLCALRFARKANGVSKLHGEVSRDMWGKFDNICPIISITNAQNWLFWSDKDLDKYANRKDNILYDNRKKHLKRRTFEIVADQTGKMFDSNILTIVWARRFAGYKRADLLTWDEEKFIELISNKTYPVQIIWAGKPYPLDQPAIDQFNRLVYLSKLYKNVAVLVGYEITLSKRLKQGADIWLNNPRIPREASGTSGMTAAMNGALNFSTNDGWIPEFIKDKVNGFIVPEPDYKNMTTEELDTYDLNQLYKILNEEIIPLYYNNYPKYRNMVYQSMNDVRYQFDSNRMATEYYELMYNGE